MSLVDKLKAFLHIGGSDEPKEEDIPAPDFIPVPLQEHDNNAE